MVCLGFPLFDSEGIRGGVDLDTDPVLEVKTPTLFVVGQQASDMDIDDMEDFR